MAVRSKRVQTLLSTTAANYTIYTTPTGFVAKVDKITFTNPSTTDSSGHVLMFGGTGVANEIIPTLSVPKNDSVSPSVSNHTLASGDTVVITFGGGVNINAYLSITERTQP